MKSLLPKLFALTGLIAASAVLATSAVAQCAMPGDYKLEKQSWSGGGARLMQVDSRFDLPEPIVGMWNIVLTGKGNNNKDVDGVVIDKGLQQWHVDGTEFLNSSFQKPFTQNYCLGVWEKIGPSTYALNHFAYLFTPEQAVAGIINIREEVTVNRDGTRYSGTFSIQPYDLLRNRLPGAVKGVVKGTKLDVTTSAQDVL